MSLLLPLAAHTGALPPCWRALALRFFASADGGALQAFLAQRVASGARVYPAQPLRALALTPAATVRVVVVGQDPYHGVGQADGLAFSVPDGQRLPPSLRNIFYELARDLRCPRPVRGDLAPWARQGVLLLNRVLTVEAQRPGAHAGRGWERFTSQIIAHLAADARPKVFMLWGAFAQAQRATIDAAAARHRRHLILVANHPSPLSARRPPTPFIGCAHFSQANAFLAAHGRGAIDWCGLSCAEPASA